MILLTIITDLFSVLFWNLCFFVSQAGMKHFFFKHFNISRQGRPISGKEHLIHVRFKVKFCQGEQINQDDYSAMHYIDRITSQYWSPGISCHAQCRLIFHSLSYRRVFYAHVHSKDKIKI